MFLLRLPCFLCHLYSLRLLLAVRIYMEFYYLPVTVILPVLVVVLLLESLLLVFLLLVYRVEPCHHPYS
jgi:hypothetical protein